MGVASAVFTQEAEKLNDNFSIPDAALLYGLRLLLLKTFPVIKQSATCQTLKRFVSLLIVIRC